MEPSPNMLVLETELQQKKKIESLKRGYMLNRTINYWLTESNILLNEIGRLSREVVEIGSWANEHVHKRLITLLENSREWTERIANIRATSKKMLGKRSNFLDRPDQLQQSIDIEQIMWDEHGYSDGADANETMTIQEIIVFMEKWILRTRVLPKWKTTITGLVAEWDGQLKMKIQRSDRKCARRLNSLLKYNKEQRL